jgi:hypothetical protein
MGGIADVDVRENIFLKKSRELKRVYVWENGAKKRFLNKSV